MFSYNLLLATKSLKDRVSLTVLMILAISVGLGLYMTIKTMAHQSKRVPLAHKSEQVYLIQMDNRELTADPINRQARMVDTTYKDTINLMELQLPGVEQTFTWKTHGVLNVEDENITPVRTQALVGTTEFFSMFEPRFLYGRAWDKSDEQSGAAVVVISKRMNDQLFGGIDSVGQKLRINTLDMTVVGVLDTWNLPRRFYDRSYRSSNPDDFYIPYTFALNNELPRDAGFDCWSTEAENSRAFRTRMQEQLLNSECAWITFWAEIPDDQIDEYNRQLVQYIETQKQLGRFPREIQTYVTNLDDQIADISSRNGFFNMFNIIATLFFAVCLINAVGILLAKFMRRSREVALRRALGAKKSTIIFQHLLEVIILGSLGGALGLVVSYYGLQGLMHIQLYASDYQLLLEDLRPMYSLDLEMIGAAFGIAIASTIVVGIYPIWRICNIPPASQLKSS